MEQLKGTETKDAADMENWHSVLKEYGFSDIQPLSKLLKSADGEHCYWKADYNGVSCFIKCRKSLDSLKKEYKAMDKLSKLYPEYFPKTLLHTDLSGNRKFLAIEYINGDVLTADLIEQSSDEKRKRIFDSIYNIALILYENKMIHRDFNCDNLMVQEDGTTKLFDFQHVLGEDLPEDELNIQNPKRLRGTNKKLRPAPYTWDDMYSAYHILQMFERYDIPEYTEKMNNIKSKIGNLRNDFLQNKFPLSTYLNYKCFIFYKIYGIFQKCFYKVLQVEIS